MTANVEDEKLEAIMEKIRLRPDFPLSSIRQMIIDYSTSVYNKGLDDGKTCDKEKIRV